MEKWDNTKLDIVSDITSIPLPDNSVDAILYTEVFEHIPDAISALKEFNRLLKPGGTMLITAPFCSLTHFAPYHFCGYSRYWYKHHLELWVMNI
jgi:ubiquinone/menaquinone biosynthesis C-methylase UbiE